MATVLTVLCVSGYIFVRLSSGCNLGVIMEKSSAPFSFGGYQFETVFRSEVMAFCYINQ